MRILRKIAKAWADSANRSMRNKKWMPDRMLTARIDRRKSVGKPISMATARASAAKSTIRAHLEHAFARLKNWFGLFIRRVAPARAEAKLTLWSLA